MTERTINVELTEYELRQIGSALREYKDLLVMFPTDYALLDETAGERVHRVQGIHDKIAMAFMTLKESDAGDFMVDAPPNDKVNEVY